MFMVRHSRGSIHGDPIAVSGIGHTGKHINSFDSVIHMQESPPHKRFLVGCSSPLMRFAEHFTAHGTSRLVLYGASDACLLGKKPDVLLPGIAGMRGSMVLRPRPCMIMSTPPPQHEYTPSTIFYVCFFFPSHALSLPCFSSPLPFVALIHHCVT